MSNLDVIKGLLPDNTVREISEEDLRDSFGLAYEDIEKKLTEDKANLLYLALSEFVTNGKIRADKIEASGITDLIIAVENTLVDFAANNSNYEFQNNDFIAIPDLNGNYSLYMYKGGNKSVYSNYIPTGIGNVTIAMIQGLQQILDNKLDIPNNNGNFFLSNISGVTSWEQIEPAEKYLLYWDNAFLPSNVFYDGLKLGIGTSTPTEMLHLYDGKLRSKAIIFDENDEEDIPKQITYSEGRFHGTDSAGTKRTFAWSGEISETSTYISNPVLSNNALTLVIFYTGETGIQQRGVVDLTPLKNNILADTNLGYKGNLKKIDPAPTEIGMYRLLELGDYTNLTPAVDEQGASIVIQSVANKLNQAYYDGSLWQYKGIEMPHPQVDGKVEENNIKAVSGGSVYTFVNNNFFNEVLDLGVLQNLAITSTGYTTSHAEFTCTNFINVNQGDEFTYTGKVTAEGTNVPTNAYAVAGYNASNIFVEFLLGNTVNDSGTFTINNPAIVKIRSCSRIPHALSLSRKKATINDELIYRSQVINPVGNNLPSEKAVADYVDLQSNNIINDLLFTTVLNPALIDSNIGSSGYPQPNTGFDCTEYIPVVQGDKFKYEGKVIDANNVPGAAYAVAGYDNTNYFVEFLLGNTVNDSGTFTINNPAIVNIRASSRKTSPLKLSKILNQIPNSKVEDYDSLEDRVEYLENNSDVGKYKTNLSWKAIGDSITFANLYQSAVMEKLEFLGYENRGYAGKGFVDDAERGSILSNIQNIGSADLYTLFGGTNDFRLDKPLGVWNDYINDTGSTTFYGALRKTIDLLYTKNASCKIMIFTPLRRNNAGYTSFSTNAVGHTLNDYREALIQMAQYEALTILDLFNDSGITDRNLSIYTSDGLHPRATGHALISQRIITEIKRITA